MKLISRNSCMSVKSIGIDKCFKCENKATNKVKLITYFLVFAEVYLCDKCAREFINNELKL